MSQPQNRQQEQGNSYDGAETLTARKRFFPNHHQHQGPAAAETEHSVAQPQPPGRSRSFAVVAYEEAKGGTALLQTTFLQRAELKSARQCEGGCPNHPGVQVEPHPTMHQPVNLGVAQESHLYYEWAFLFSAGMHHHVHHRHARWKHHRHRHHLPASQEHHQGRERWKMTLLEQVVMVDQVGQVGNYCQQGKGPRSNYHGPGPQDKCPRARSGSCTLLVFQFSRIRCTHQAPPCTCYITWFYASKWKLP